MNSNFWRTLGLALILCGLAACSSMESRTRKLQLGMSRAQVVGVLGSSYMVVGARQESAGAVEVLRFGGKGDDPIFAYFRDGKLVQWGDHEMLQQAPESR